MYSKTILVGRWVKEMDLKMLPGSGNAMLKNTIAIDRAYQKDKEKQSDFINVIMWGKTAEFVSQYSEKGRLVIVEGHIQTGSYDNKEGKKVYTFDVVADNVKPIEWASKSEKSDFRPADPVDVGSVPF